MALTNTHYKVIIGILIVSLGISLVFNVINYNRNSNKNLVTYESVEGGDHKNTLKVQFPNTWMMKSGRTSIVFSSPDQKAQFFLPMTQTDLEGFTPLSDEPIKINDKTYTKKTYGNGDIKAVFIEDFSYGTTKGVGYRYQDESQKSTLDHILLSQQILQ